MIRLYVDITVTDHHAQSMKNGSIAYVTLIRYSIMSHPYIFIEHYEPDLTVSLIFLCNICQQKDRTSVSYLVRLIPLCYFGNIQVLSE